MDGNAWRAERFDGRRSEGLVGIGFESRRGWGGALATCRRYHEHKMICTWGSSNSSLYDSHTTRGFHDLTEDT